MRVFAVHFSSETPNEQAGRLRDAFPDLQHYRLSERFYLVRADTIAQQVADKIGLDGNDPDGPTGVVFRLNASNAGFDEGAVWDWLRLSK